MDYTSLLSGATGSLGFGGGVGGGGGGGGYGSAASSATSGPITSGDITPNVGNISSGGVNLSPTVNFYAHTDGTLGDAGDINPPLSIFAPKNLLWLVAGFVGVFVLIRLYR